MASRGTSIATAFVWAVGMAAGFGVGENLINHDKSSQVENDVGVAAIVAAVVGYNVRRRSPS